MSVNKLKLNPDKNRIPHRERTAEEQISLSVLVGLLDFEVNPTMSAQNLGLVFDENATFHAVTIFWICHIFADSLALKLQQNYSKITCFDASITVFGWNCLELQTSTSPNLSMSRIDWPMLRQSHHHLFAVFHS